MRIQLSRRSQAALTFWEVMIVLAVLAIVACVVLLRPARPRVKRLGCVNNFKQIGVAFRGWSIDMGDKFPMQTSVTNGGSLEAKFASSHFLLLSNEINNPKILQCPVDVERTNSLAFSSGLIDSNISYFVNLDAEVTNADSFLSGDRNLAVNGTVVGVGPRTVLPQSMLSWTSKLHNKQGNILLSDGSVQSWSSSNLNWMIKLSGVATNRLLIP